MTPELWQRTAALYSAAMRLPLEERVSFAEEATAGDPPLRQELLELLEAKAPETDFLEHPPVRLDLPITRTTAPDTPPPFAPGDIVCDGRFRVEQIVGRGGMGRVYRATDISLGRIVALKTVAVPGALVETTAVRLRREAALVSQLNHPGICTLYDLWRYGGMDVAVMEFVEGETLAARLSRVGMTQEAAIKTVMEVLDALDYAHRHHVAHRDVKPANVILTKTGTKLLDFGIAKVWPQTTGQRNAANANAGRSEDTTEERSGFAPGTPAYMAPEQLAREPVDARADIYSVGVMLCEMLTRAPGAGRTPLNVDAISPPLLKRVVARCLAVDPDARWQTAGDLKAALDMALLSGAAEPEPPRPVASRTPRLLGAALAAALVALAGTWWFWPRASGTPAHAIEFRVGPPPGTEFPPLERGGPPVVSPDGSLLAMAVRDGTGETSLWLRRLDSSVPVAIPGTEGATHPFWSPDSKQIGFFAKGKLRAIPAAGGAARVLCDAVQGRGGAWSPSGVIVFAPGLSGELSRVAEAGGVATTLTHLDRAGGEDSHRWPSFLPDGTRLLFVVRAATESRSGLFTTSLDGEKPVKVGNISSSATFVPDSSFSSRGDLLYVRGNQILTQPFDARRMALEQEPRTVAELGWSDVTTSRAPVSASNTGLLVYGGGYPESFQLAWQNAGKPANPVIDPGGPARFVRLSPDARTAAIERLDFRTGAGSIWLLDTMSGAPSRLTFGEVGAFAPVWSRDGKSIIYTATPGGAFEITSLPAEPGRFREGDQKVLLHFGDDEPAIATDVAPDGSIILEVRDPKSKRWDIVAIKPGPDPQHPGERVRIAEKPSDERQARLSPDGRWVAFVSNESGTNQVYVSPLRGAGRIQVSLRGGTQPSWGRASNEVYFVADDRSLMRGVVDYAGLIGRAAPAGGSIPQLSIQGLMTGWEYGIAGGTKEYPVFAGLQVPHNDSDSVVVLQGWQAHIGR